MKTKFLISFCVLLLLACKCWSQDPAAPQVEDKNAVASYDEAAKRGSYTDNAAIADFGESKGRFPKASAHSGLPVLCELKQPEEPAQAQLQRQQREAYFKRRIPGRGELTDPGKFIGDHSETYTPLIMDYVIVSNPGAPPPVEPNGLPVQETTVVIGTIQSGKCFVSEHYVYTDYVIHIESVLKESDASSVSLGDEVVASRFGGAVHFPSGHIRHICIQGMGLPKLGSRYVLFLDKSLPTLSEYEIATAYELRDNGRVYALDDRNSEFTLVEQMVFLDQLQKLIAKLAKGGQQ